MTQGHAAPGRRLPAAALSLLAAGSALLRSRELDAGFWIDEALSVGIADRPIGDIPGVLRQDGSPPLYYLLLHLWMRLLGDRGEEATRALSLLFAVLAVPAAFAVARALFGGRAGWAAAALTAVNPFLTQYAQETRMYSLVVLLGIVAAGGFAGAFVLDRGSRWVVAFAAALAGLLYTHAWALFLAAACVLAWVALTLRARGPRRRRVARRGAAAFGAVAVAFAPWLPTLLFQAAHTGAPWAYAPSVGQGLEVPLRLFGEAPLAALGMAGAVALAGAWPRLGPGARAAAALAGISAATVLAAWLASQVSPVWASRYLAVVAGPLLLVAALATARAGRAGLVALAIAVPVSAGLAPAGVKSNAREVAALLAPALAAGDLVVATQPEQAPVLAHYLRGERALRWATLTGPLPDLGVTDWRDGVDRLERASPARDLAPLLDRVPPGGRVALVEPEVVDPARWTAPWTRLVRIRSAEWRAWLRADGRFRVVAVRPERFALPHPNPVRATLFVRDGVR